MEYFKKSFFGGYKRTDVQAKIWELEKRAERFEKDHEALESVRDEQKAAAEKQRLLAEQKDREILSLQKEIERLNSEIKKNRRDDASAAIGGVYLKAYESGTEIINFSRQQTNAFLDNIEEVADKAYEQFNAARGDFAGITDSVDALIAQINGETARLRQRVTELTGEASQVFDAYRSAQKIRESVDGDIKSAMERYTSDAEQFLNLPAFSNTVKGASSDADQPQSEAPCPPPSEDGDRAPADDNGNDILPDDDYSPVKGPLLHVL